MSALEKFSINPLPARHLRGSDALAVAVARADIGAYDLDVRLAERLLPEAIFVLQEPASGDVLVWPAGVMGRRVSIEPLARLLLEHSSGSEEQWIPEVLKHPPFLVLPLVRDGGPLSFASVPLGCNEGGRLAALRGAGPWTEDDRSLLRDLGLSFGHACERLSPRSDPRELADSAGSAGELDARPGERRRSDRLASFAPLLRGLCHELNNPLTSIKSFAELLLLDARSEEDREALEIVQREAHRAARIVGDLRMVARQSAETSMSKELVDLNELVRHVLAGRRQELRVERITVLEQLDPDLPSVRAVRPQLEHVVSHLLTNAVASLEGWEGEREIVLSTVASPGGVRFSVRDTGRGLVAEHLGRIERDDTPSGTSAETFNLGLSLVESIIAHHGGLVESRARIDQGALITVDLPNDQQDADVLAGEDACAGRKLRLLLVDEEGPIRRSLARYLERRGHQVRQMADGAAALRLMGGCSFSRDYDIVLAELDLPGLEGERLMTCLRERADGLEQRLILMTAELPEPEAAAELDDSGVPLLLKPFELAEVAQVVEAQAEFVLG